MLKKDRLFKDNYNRLKFFKAERREFVNKYIIKTLIKNNSPVFKLLFFRVLRSKPGFWKILYIFKYNRRIFSGYKNTGSRIVNFCVVTGKSHFVLQKFKLYRAWLRTNIRFGNITGTSKASW